MVPSESCEQRVCSGLSPWLINVIICSHGILPAHSPHLSSGSRFPLFYKDASHTRARSPQCPHSNLLRTLFSKKVTFGSAGVKILAYGLQRVMIQPITMKL